MVTGTTISRNGRYLAMIEPPDVDEGQEVNYYAKTGNTLSVYDTTTLQLEWTCETNLCHYLAINDHGNFVFVIAHRLSFIAFECQVKDGVKVIVQHELPEISTTLDALCFLKEDHLIVGTSEGKLVKIDLNKLQGKPPYQTLSMLSYDLQNDGRYYS